MKPSDLDQLADYAEGLLDGTPDADAIAARIATDQEWADAYRQLAAVLPGISADLGALPEIPMPADVAAALDRTLAEQPPLAATRPSDGDDNGAAQPWVAPQPTDDLDRLRSERAARKSRTARAGGWAVAAAAAAVVAIAGVGVFQSFDLQGSDDSAETSAVGNSTPKVMSGPGVPSIHVSGTSYSSAELGTQSRALLENRDESAPRQEASSSADRPAAGTPKAAVPAALRRLLGPADLQNCLTALGLGAPVVAVDYATLDGAPAIIVVADNPGSDRLTIVAAGPDCGAQGFGDERTRTTVSR
ncbi:hypothetical protein [Cryptosporangium minutisporangium]|uniref:Anti-sigma factor n=1 Tax=Cryptosporangium minutisporangium TaxID=113569 RepID=A0ABP6T5S3_9ACTN